MSRSCLLPLAALIVLITPAMAAELLWTVNLHDVHLPEEFDGLIDITRSESVEFTPDGRSIVTAGYFYDSITQDSTGEVLVRSVEDGSIQAKLNGTASYALRAGVLAISPSGDW